MNDKTNALAELAERLNFDVDELNGKHKDHLGIYQCVIDDVRIAQRIVAELAKVEDVTEVHNLKLVQRPNSWQCYDAVVMCRAIAEEGAGNA